MNLKILSGSTLKVIAMISMLIDHSTKVLLSGYEGMNTVLFSVGNLRITPFYCLSSGLGRLAFPLFAFLVVEGYQHTRSFARYARTLLLFAIISILPYNYEHGGVLSFHGNNVLFTLLLGVICLYAIDHASRFKAALIVAAALLTSLLIRCDYGPSGVALIVTMYLLRQRREYQCLPLAIAFMSRKYAICAALAAIPIMMYNGERGFIRGNVGKYLIYIFYPLHLLILGYLRS